MEHALDSPQFYIKVMEGWWGAYFCCMLYTLGLLVLKLLDNSPTYLCLPAHERGAADTGVYHHHAGTWNHT